jgi:hypothetical protein
MFRFRRRLVVLLALFGAACGNDVAGPDPATPPRSGLFDPAVLHEVRVEMSARDWQTLKDFYWKDDFYPAAVTIDGDSVSLIGVRSRGQGSRSETKPSLKLDFNRYVRGQRFHGQKSLAIKNLVQDVSMMRDYLAMWVFEGMGIAAPRYSFARMFVNGEAMGVFNIVESVEEPFLHSRFGEDGGNLFNYEYGMPPDTVVYDLGDRGPHVDDYIPRPFKPQTNLDRFDGRGLVQFIRTVNDAPASRFLTDVAGHLDVDRFLTYVAVENALAEQDGFVGRFGMNNFFLYQYAATSRFVVIPWDKNTAFTDARWPIDFNLHTNVLTRRLTADPVKMKVYREAVGRAGRSYVNEAYLVPKLDAAYTLIRAAALADTKKPYSNEQLESGVGGLRGWIGERSADIAAQAR